MQGEVVRGIVGRSYRAHLELSENTGDRQVLRGKPGVGPFPDGVGGLWIELVVDTKIALQFQMAPMI